MKFLTRIFGRSNSDQVSTLDDTQLLKEVEQSLRRHISRVTTAFVADDSSQMVESRWNILLRPDILTFAVTAVDQEMKKSLSENLHRYQGKSFGDIYVAVSAIPVEDPSKARAYFGSGYFGFLDVLLNESGYGSGDMDLAHWVCCQGAMHLTCLPATKLTGPRKPFDVVFAQDLMTAEEKIQAGKS